MTSDCILDPRDYPDMCYSCQNYLDYGPVAGRDDYNGECKVDNHKTDALVKCKIDKYIMTNLNEE